MPPQASHPLPCRCRHPLQSRCPLAPLWRCPLPAPQYPPVQFQGRGYGEGMQCRGQVEEVPTASRSALLRSLHGFISRGV